MPSKKILEEKQKIVGELTSRINGAKSIIFSDYRGLTVEQDRELRNELRRSSVDYFVVKNTLLKYAIINNNINGLNELLSGPTSIAISKTDHVLPAKILNDYSKKFEQLKLKIGVIDGTIVTESQIASVAELPSKEVLISNVLRSLNTPITSFVSVLNNTLRSLVCVLNAVHEKKNAEQVV